MRLPELRTADFATPKETARWRMARRGTAPARAPKVPPPVGPERDQR